MRIDGVGPAAAGAVPVGAAGDKAAQDDLKLRGAARQLTGLFAQQLFKAMRETVPTDEGVVSGGSGEEMFTGMLDEHLAGVGATNAGVAPGGGATGEAGAAFTRGLADAVYRRLRAHAGATTGGAAPDATSPKATGAAATVPTLPLVARPTAGMPLSPPALHGLSVTPAPAAASLPVRPSSALTGLR